MRAKLIDPERAVKPGELSAWPNALIAGCPECGRATRLSIPPFVFDFSAVTLGPDAALLACGAVVTLKEGEWNVHTSCARDARSARAAGAADR
ncbi:MAG: hypothetical protein ACYDCD_00695 [Candidatus Acidiferrales bacterium]